MAEGKIAVFVYARMDSSRFPGKVLKLLEGVPLLEIVTGRLRKVPASSYVVLTSSRPIDDPIAEFGSQVGWEVVRGDSSDLVSRTLKALDAIECEHFVRVNADSPLVDAELIAQASSFRAGKNVVSNLISRTFPYGVAVEIVATEYYRSKARLALPQEKEHVTSHIYRTLESGQSISLLQAENQSELRLTVDTPDDLALLSALLEGRSVLGIHYWEIFGGFARPQVLIDSI